MPFTLAHPAAILPFTFIRRKWYSFTGLIVGSMIPDFEGFLKPGYPKVYGHTWAGMFWFDLPLGLLVAFVFHCLVRKAIIENLPSFLYKRFYQFRQFHWITYFRNNALKVVASLLIGITTHLVWDRVTHTDTYSYAEKAGIIIPAEEKTELRIVLQYVSTVLGVVFMGWWIWKLPHSDRIVFQRQWKPYWFIVTGVLILTWFYLPKGPIRALDYNVANTGITGTLTGIIVASAFYQLRKKNSLDN